MALESVWEGEGARIFCPWAAGCQRDFPRGAHLCQRTLPARKGWIVRPTSPLITRRSAKSNAASRSIRGGHGLPSGLTSHHARNSSPGNAAQAEVRLQSRCRLRRMQPGRAADSA